MLISKHDHNLAIVTSFLLVTEINVWVYSSLSKLISFLFFPRDCEQQAAEWLSASSLYQCWWEPACSCLQVSNFSLLRWQAMPPWINSTVWKERSFSATQWSLLKAQQLHVTETTLGSALLMAFSNCRACEEGFFFFAWKVPSTSLGNIFEISRHSPDCSCSPFACKEVQNAQVSGAGIKNRLLVPCNLKARLLLIHAIPYIFHAVELLVLLLESPKPHRTPV